MAVTEKKRASRRPVITPKLDEAGCKKAELELRKTYKNIVPGSFKDIELTPGSPHYMKRTVEITCAKRGCKATRRVATSDLAQVTMCPEHTRDARLARRRLARQKAK